MVRCHELLWSIPRICQLGKVIGEQLERTATLYCIVNPKRKIELQDPCMRSQHDGV
jgi:hypothetical protein